MLNAIISVTYLRDIGNVDGHCSGHIEQEKEYVPKHRISIPAYAV
jgi:hypothetical protein